MNVDRGTKKRRKARGKKRGGDEKRDGQEGKRERRKTIRKGKWKEEDGIGKRGRRREGGAEQCEQV